MTSDDRPFIYPPRVPRTITCEICGQPYQTVNRGTVFTCDRPACKIERKRHYQEKVKRKLNHQDNH